MITIPKATVEDFASPRQTVFPEGTWTVALEATRERSFPDFIAANVASGKNTGYASGDGEILGLQFGSARSAEGETTNQKLFLDLVTRDGDTSIEDSEIPGASWQLQNSQALVALFAQAAGAIEEVTGPDGEEMLSIADGFVDELREGNLPEVVVEVYHRNWKTATKSGTEVKVRNVMQAV